MRSFLLLLSILWWVGIAAVVVNHNVAPFGVTFHWPNPQKPTAHFSWHQIPQSVSSPRHAVKIDPGTTNRFTVTLPRGFVQGTLRVSYYANLAGDKLRLEAQTLPGKRVAAEGNDSAASLDFLWADLAARGRRFDFALTALDTREPVLIQSIDIFAHTYTLR